MGLSNGRQKPISGKNSHFKNLYMHKFLIDRLMFVITPKYSNLLFNIDEIERKRRSTVVGAR